MAEESEDGNTYTNFMSKYPLFTCIIREHLWLKKCVVSKEKFKSAIEDPSTFKDYSVLASLKADGKNVDEKEEVPLKINGKSQNNRNKQLKLYEDLDWAKIPEYYWPVHAGDYSPLTPDSEFVERHGKIGLDFWRWHRESSPLGYVPPLCTCKRTEDCVKYLRRWTREMRLEFDHRVCSNDVCRGLLYVPYSLLEIPLNRAISNCSEFAMKVNVPNSTDVYCGNMKHTIILCTTSKRHEEECLEAIEASDVSSPLVYDVHADDFMPYFKKHDESDKESPLMTVEPIDSDVSEPEENYGVGQLFAIRRVSGKVLIEKYDPTLKTTSPVDEELMKTWNKMSTKSVPSHSETGSHYSDSFKDENFDSCSTAEIDGNVKSKGTTEEELKVETKGDPDVHTKEEPDLKHEDDVKTEVKEEPMAKVEVEDNVCVDYNGHEKRPRDETKQEPEVKSELDYETLETLKRELEKQEFRVYELIESFSNDRRPLNFTLRNGDEFEDKNGFRNGRNKRRKGKINRKTLESLHLMETLSKF